MNTYYRKDQFSENFQTIMTNNITPQINLEQVAIDSRMNIPHVAVENANIHSQNQHYENPASYAIMTRIPHPLVNMTVVNPPPDNFLIDLHHHIAFFYQPPNDLYNYCIKCKEISFDTVNNFKENESIFFYKRQSCNRIYQIVCEKVSPSLIIDFLNKTIYGIEIEQNVGYEQLSITFDQKENLKLHLKQHLDRYLLD